MKNGTILNWANTSSGGALGDDADNSFGVATTTVAVAILSAVVIHQLFRIVSRRRRSKCPPFPPATPIDELDNPLKRGLKKSNLPEEADAVVIGSGPAGLSTASLLTRRGYRVLVLEQHDRAGGGLHSFVEKGQYEFDTGFHYCGELAPHEPLKKIVDVICGGSSDIEWKSLGDCPVEPGIYDQVHFLNEDYNDNGSSSNKFKPFNVPCGRDKWIQELKRTFPEEVEAIDAYIKEMEACMKTGLIYAIWRSLPHGSLLSRLLKPILGAPAISFNTQIAGNKLNALTSNERLRAILGYISFGCTGICPDEMNYAVMLGIHSHFSNGAHYPVNGTASIASAMVKVIERGGGRVLVRAGVDRILVEEDSNGKVKTVGVQLVKDGLVVKSPVVISTIGLRETVDGLLRKPLDPGPAAINSGFSGRVAKVEDPLPTQQREELNRLLKDLPWGKGHMYGFFGIKQDNNSNDQEEEASLNLPKCNCWILPGYDLRKGQDAFANDPMSGNPFGYIGFAFPSEKDPNYQKRLSIKDGRTVAAAAFVAGDVPWEWFQQWADTRVHKRGEEYEKFKDSFKERLLDILYMKYPQVKGKVEYIDLGTPIDTRTYLGKLTGASYGIPPTVAKAKADATWLGPAMPELLPDGMYMAGQDITMDGFASAVLSALMVTASIEGFLAWLDVVPMLGGLIETIKIL